MLHWRSPQRRRPGKAPNRFTRAPTLTDVLLEPEAEGDGKVLAIRLLRRAGRIGELRTPDVVPPGLDVELRRIPESERDAAAQVHAHIPGRSIADDLVHRDERRIADIPPRIADRGVADRGRGQADGPVVRADTANSIGLHRRFAGAPHDAVEVDVVHRVM